MSLLSKLQLPDFDEEYRMGIAKVALEYLGPDVMFVMLAYCVDDDRVDAARDVLITALDNNVVGAALSKKIQNASACEFVTHVCLREYGDQVIVFMVSDTSVIVICIELSVALRPPTWTIKLINTEEVKDDDSMYDVHRMTKQCGVGRTIMTHLHQSVCWYDRKGNGWIGVEF